MFWVNANLDFTVTHENLFFKLQNFDCSKFRRGTVLGIVPRLQTNCDFISSVPKSIHSSESQNHLPRGKASRCMEYY